MLHQVLEQLRKPPEQLCQLTCIWLTQQLGDLAYWWLRPEVLSRLPEEFRRVTPSYDRREPGSCAILFAQNDANNFPALQPAFLLPLRWCQGGSNGPQLPETVVQLALQVCKTLQLECWHLQLDVKHPPSVSLAELAAELGLSAESGWGWLAAGLILVTSSLAHPRDQVLPRPDFRVWITASWSDEQGISPVGLLETKVRFAAESGARWLFVPASQVSEAKSYLGPASQLRIEGLYENTRDARKALEPCLPELELQPPDNAPDHIHQNYYKRQAQWNRERARAYYRQRLIPKIVERLSSQWHQLSPPLTHLVTILSDNPELIHIAIESTGARRCLILATSDKDAQHRQTVQNLRSPAQTCEFVWRVYDHSNELLCNLKRDVNQFVEDAEPDRVGIDLTPGTKEMTLTLAFEAARPKNKLIYLRHRIDQQLVVPFSEEWIIFNRRMWEAAP